MRRCLTFLTLLALLWSFNALAKPHLRLFATVISNNIPKNSLAGSSLGSGLWQSDDLGITWKQIGWTHVKAYSVDAVKKDNYRTIYLACGNGVMRSTDEGLTWKVVTDWRITEVMDIVIDQAHPKNIYIATAHGVWESIDHGNHWKSIQGNRKTPYTSRITIDTVTKSLVIAGEDGLYTKSLKGGKWVSTGYQNAVRDFFRSKNGSWMAVSSSGEISLTDSHFKKTTVLKEIEGTPWAAFPDSTGSLYTLVGGKEGLLPVHTPMERQTVALSGPIENIHAIYTYGPYVWLGTLGKGIYRNRVDANEYSYVGLNDNNVWRIRGFEVE